MQVSLWVVWVRMFLIISKDCLISFLYRTGCGSIGRGFKGEFRRWSLQPGRYLHRDVQANVLSVRSYRANTAPQAKVLSVNSPSPDSPLRNWRWGELPQRCATYHALFPFSWTEYREPLENVYFPI